MRKLIINSDHDKTICRDFSTTAAIRFNSSLSPEKALRGLVEEPTGGRGQLLPEAVVRGYLSFAKKGGLSSLEDIARCGEWGLYEAGLLPKRDLIAIKAALLEGLSEEDLGRAAKTMAANLNPGAIGYARGIAEDGHAHILVSDGWYPLVKATADALEDCGARFGLVEANIPIFEGGRFSGRIHRMDKLEAASMFYTRHGHYPDIRSVYVGTVMVDDSPENIGLMRSHELGIAFRPTELGKREFAAAGIEVQDSNDLLLTLERIRSFSG